MVDKLQSQYLFYSFAFDAVMFINMKVSFCPDLDGVERSVSDGIVEGIVERLVVA